MPAYEVMKTTAGAIKEDERGYRGYGDSRFIRRKDSSRCSPPVLQINNQNRQNQRNHLDWTTEISSFPTYYQIIPDHMQQGCYNKNEEQLCAKDNAKTVTLEEAKN